MQNEHCVVTLGIAGDLPQDHPQKKRVFTQSLERLQSSLRRVSFSGDILCWDTELPKGSPSHASSPFGFKPFCMKHALDAGYKTVLWMDASVVAKDSLVPIFEWARRTGYVFFPENHSIGAFCKDEALATLGITREASFKAPSCWACVLGLDFGHANSRAFLAEWLRLAVDGVTFPGPKWSGVGDYPRTASQDERVLGHRYDQTAASVLAMRFGMKRWLSRATFDAFFSNERKSTYETPT